MFSIVWAKEDERRIFMKQEQFIRSVTLKQSFDTRTLSAQAFGQSAPVA
ncbi:hypothetical protein C4K01_4179 [Pseudomonas synxantha]|nr:hypothetical protein C4K01_4179 [Pseudomonas synxantha]